VSGRVAGHTLRAEGAPHVVTETGATARVWNGYGGIGGYGRGLCSCGAMSGLLDSAHQRKAWHRRHKAIVNETKGDA
jgi:hypothetical protein